MRFSFATLCSPLVLLALVTSACTPSAPSLMRLECSGQAGGESTVFDRRTGQLYFFDRVREVYMPSRDDRFTVKTKGRLQGDTLVIESRVGTWGRKDGKRVLTPITPAVGSDFSVDLTTFKSTRRHLSNKGPGFPSTAGQCKRIPLASDLVEVSALKRVTPVR